MILILRSAMCHRRTSGNFVVQLPLLLILSNGVRNIKSHCLTVTGIHITVSQPGAIQMT